MEKCKMLCEDRKDLQSGTEVSSQLCLSELPIAILHEIFYKLPIISIMNVKFVSTSLYKLLSDPNFALNYSKNSPFTPLLNYKQCSPQNYLDPGLNLVEISDNNNRLELTQTTLNAKQLPTDLSIANSRLTLAHACDGLVCLSLSQPEAETAYICNPIMGECKMLPEHRVNRNEYHNVQYGFGFCRSINKYKVLRIICVSEREPGRGEGEVLTVGVDSAWRDLPNPVLPAPVINKEFYSVNGVLHWLVFDRSYNASIRTFDLAKEKCGEMITPLGTDLNFFRIRLTVFDECLCFVDYFDNTGPPAIVIWKLTEYGVTDSWTKDIRIETAIPPTLMKLVPVARLRDGDIVFCHSLSSDIISYNPEKKIFKEVVVGYRGNLGYAPKFLSLKDVLRERDWSTMNV